MAPLALAILAPATALAQSHTHALTVWHGYRGRELDALEAVIAEARRDDPSLVIETLAVPFSAYASKLENGITHGEGPDVFIDGHDRLTTYLARGLVAPIEGVREHDFDETALDALTVRDVTYAVPLALKCLALYVNTDLAPVPPASFEQLAALRATLPTGVYPLVYASQDAYFHVAFAHAFGAGLIDDATGRYLFAGLAAERSVAYAIDLVRTHVVPDEIDGSLVTQLFANGRAATAISGPWFAADLPDTVHYTVVPLPVIASLGRAPEPYLTVEGAFVSSRARHPIEAQAFVRRLVSHRASLVRATQGHQVVATLSVWSDPAVSRDTFLTRFREAARHARPMPRHPFTPSAFEPAASALRRAFRASVPVATALADGRSRFLDATRALPSPRSPVPALLALGALAFALALRAVARSRDPAFRASVRRSLPAYAYVAHAVLAVFVLVVLPLVAGAATSLFAGRNGTLYYAGLANYVDILTAHGGPLFATRSFYLVLLVTIAWTLANLVLHVSIGVALALLLSRTDLRFKSLYRVMLIVPWAVPSYVTALAWRGMFHRQLGAINAILHLFGVEPVAWFARFSTSFAANVVTNTWLGFPFMMVVTLGALTSIPRDLYEAAAVDGATAWQRFVRITVPLLRPALAPSIAMGAVWTFNMFNVIFLVSGGEPDGQTEILVTEAYRWAFTRQAQYGYASAYAVLIFGILLLGTRALGRVVERVQRA